MYFSMASISTLVVLFLLFEFGISGRKPSKSPYTHTFRPIVERIDAKTIPFLVQETTPQLILRFARGSFAETDTAIVVRYSSLLVTFWTVTRKEQCMS